MLRLFGPAMFVMNRLPYTYKFLLISILFVCPIILLSYQLWDQLEQDIQTTSKEAEGVRIIASLSDIAFSANQYRDIMLAHQYDRSDAVIQRLSRIRAETGDKLERLVKENKDSVLLKPLSYPQSEELVALRQIAPGVAGSSSSDALNLSRRCMSLTPSRTRSFSRWACGPPRFRP